MGAPLSSKLTAQQLHDIAADTENLDDELIERIRYHPACYLALSEWATTALIAGVDNVPAPPPPEEEIDIDALPPLPRRSPKVRATVVMVVGLIVLLTAAAWAWSTISKPAGHQEAAASPGEELVVQSSQPDPTPQGVAQVAGAMSYQCRTPGEGVECWGWISDDNVKSPEAIPGLEDAAITQLGVGAGFAVAITADDSVYVWGNNDYGQHGGVPGESTWEATKVGTLPAPAAELTVGTEHACILTTEEEVLCFGSNRVGQIRGVPTTEGLPLTPISDVEDVATIGTSGHATWATTKDGQTYVWGNNKFGQVNPADTAPTLPPTLLETL